MVRPAVEKSYQSLNDEQKARLNALGADDTLDQQQVRRDLTQVCGERASGIASLPMERIERAVRPDEVQRSALEGITRRRVRCGQSVEIGLPRRSGTHRGRAFGSDGAAARCNATGVQTVQPALENFYGSLGDEQKERFNRLNPA